MSKRIVGVLTAAATTGVLMFAGASGASAAPASPRGVGEFITDGDNVHLSSTPPPTASAHGCWHKLSGDGSVATVTIWLQAEHTDGSWVTVDKEAKDLKPAKGVRGCPSVARVNSRKDCSGGIVARVHWRSIIDVDIIGVADSPEKAYTAVQTLYCRPTNSAVWG